MSKTLSPSERRRLVVSLGDFFHEFEIKPAVTGKHVKHAEPYSKREEGRERRNERRQAIARKRSFLN